jgi:type I restriction enzyme M protein
MFYNTGIATYVWLVTNRKPDHRKGKVQLIDATQWFKPLRKNLGKKNCEFSEEDIKRICDTYIAFEENEQSKIFLNAAFGYWKVIVERPLRLHSQLTIKAIESLRFASGDEDIRSEIYDTIGEAVFQNFSTIRAQIETLLNEWGKSDEDDENEDDGKKSLPEKKKKKLLDARTWERDARLVETANALRREIGGDTFEDHNVFREQVNAALDKLGLKLGATDLKILLRAVSWRVEAAPPVIAKLHKPSKAKADSLHGTYEVEVNGKKSIVEYEPDTELRDTEQVPLLEPGGIEAFIRREVLPYAPDAWIDQAAPKIGYEISFTRHFYKPQPLRTLEEIRTDIRAVEKEAEGLLDEIVAGGTK